MDKTPHGKIWTFWLRISVPAQLITVLILAAVFRFSGINWDAGAHLHPDERFLTMVATSMKWPASVPEYFDTARSRLNPHNIGSGFYVYGTLPVIMVKAVAELLKSGDYMNLTLTGRAMSAVCDLVVLLLVYRLAKLMSGLPQAGIMAAFVYATMALPIQISHFFTVDPYLTLFAVLGLTLIVSRRENPSAVAFGLAVASKISAALVLPAVAVSFLIRFIRHRNVVRSVLSVLGFTLLLAVTVRIAYPYLFSSGSLTLNPKVLKNWQELKSFDTPGAMFPPALQWDGTIPIIYPLMNLVFVGLGLPHALLSIWAGIFLIRNLSRIRKSVFVVISAALVTVFIYHGVQTAKAIRYFYVLYPLIAVISGVALSVFSGRIRRGASVTALVMAALIVWPVAVTGIYLKPHTRIAASRWIYAAAPKGSVIAGEHWDDYLPISLTGKLKEDYRIRELPVFGPDNVEKWKSVATVLAEADFVTLSSNRAYGSLTRLPVRFPQSRTYYEKLINGSLGYEIAAQFTSRPNLALPAASVCIRLPFGTYGEIVSRFDDCPQSGVSFVDDYMDETWTVYDHPKVIILHNQERLTGQEIFGRITGNI